MPSSSPGHESRRRVCTAKGAWLAALALHVVVGATAAAESSQRGLADTPLASNEEFVAILDVRHGKEDLGRIEIRLHHKYAPRHVRNFVRLAERGFYDGTCFHRIHKDSFIQGGDPLSKDKNPRNDGKGGPGYTLPKELNSKKHTRGAVAMAAKGKRDSGSQFFIDLVDKPGWDGTYTVFGHVIAGMEVADAIGRVPLNGEHPRTKVSMTVRVEKRKRKLKLY